MKKYTMKNLGYKRTPTEAWYHVKMDDRSVWRVPVQVIVDSRDDNYEDEQEDTIGFIRAGTLDVCNIGEWAVNNMNWSDVAEWAERVPAAKKAPDFQEGWVNGEKRIVGEI